jgi:hypothetical protein
MEEKKYMVLANNNILLASNMTFEMAIVFIKGYRDTYYNENLDLTIREELNCIKKDYGYQE